MGVSRDVAVRQLEAGDVAAMRALNAVFAKAFDDDDEYTKALPSDDHLSRTLALPHVVALVAEDGGQVIGGLVAYELRKLEQQRSELYIYDLAVAAGSRRQGVATALIDTLRALARARGGWVVFVQAMADDDQALALYDRLGQRKHVMSFDIAP